MSLNPNHSQQTILKALRWLDEQPNNWVAHIKDTNLAVKMYLKQKKKSKKQEGLWSQEIKNTIFNKKESTESLSAESTEDFSPKSTENSCERSFVNNEKPLQTEKKYSETENPFKQTKVISSSSTTKLSFQAEKENSVLNLEESDREQKSTLKDNQPLPFKSVKEFYMKKAPVLRENQNLTFNLKARNIKKPDLKKEPSLEEPAVLLKKFVPKKNQKQRALNRLSEREEQACFSFKEPADSSLKASRSQKDNSQFTDSTQKDKNLLAFEQSNHSSLDNSLFPIKPLTFLDEKSLKAIQHTQEKLNLQKKEEALRVLIQLGKRYLDKVFN